MLRVKRNLCQFHAPNYKLQLHLIDGKFMRKSEKKNQQKKSANKEGNPENIHKLFIFVIMSPGDIKLT